MIPETRIIVGDALTELRKMPADSVDCVITSPPYWGLRDYGTARWEGGDPSCEHTIAYDFKDEKRRNARCASPLRGDDCSKCRKCGARRVDAQIGMEPTPSEHIDVLLEVFREVRRVLKPTGTFWLNYGDCYATAPNGRAAADIKNDDRTFRDKPYSTVVEGLKPKDLVGMPWRLALALQADGWWLRNDIVWKKPNPMPESVEDRLVRAHEYIFLLAKQPKYYFDYKAIMEDCVNGDPEAPRGSKGTARPNKGLRKTFRGGGAYTGRQSFDNSAQAGNETHGNKPNPLMKRRKRDVWDISTVGYREAHFATFPPKLVKPCILAGCPWGGVILDPFGGAGTTALVANQNGRNAMLIELNPEYAEIARRRLKGMQGRML